jgi:hypothetical protein
LDESTNTEDMEIQSRDPMNITVESLELLLARYEPNKVQIFKFGAGTNLTMGYIKKIDAETTLDGTKYYNLIEVEWIDGMEFASGGDSGSLYFVYDLTISSFVPVAMHVGSKEKKSYGIIISFIFQELSNKQYKFLICDSAGCNEN